jgi:hypothetical protein
MQIGYIAVKKLDQDSSIAWKSFLKESQLTFVKDVVTLDSELCPSIVQKLSEEDWKHKAHEFVAHDIFSDLVYLEKRVSHENDVQILAILPNPTPADVGRFSNPGFDFLGYELIDIETMVDPILNCSSFRDLIPTSNLNQNALISSYDRGNELQKELLKRFPNNLHSDAVLFAIWRKK